MPAQEVVTTGGAGDALYSFVLSGAAEVFDQKLFDHFGRRFGPAMVFVYTHFDVRHAVDHAIVAQYAGSAQTTDQNRHRKWRDVWFRRYRWWTQIIVTGCPGSCAADENMARRQAKGENGKLGEMFHSVSPYSGFDAFP